MIKFCAHTFTEAIHKAASLGVVYDVDVFYDNSGICHQDVKLMYKNEPQ